MGIINYLKRAFSQPFTVLMQTGWNTYLGGGYERKYLEEYRGWVYACVQARAEAVGNIDLELWVDGEEIEEHPLLDLLYRVNPTMTKEDLFMGTQAFLDLDGNAFWFLARDKKGKGAVQEIWLMRPDLVQIVHSKENPLLVDGYIYQSGGQKIPFGANEVLHFKNFRPMAEWPFPHRGLGVVEAASWSIDSDNEARQWNYSFFKNSARPDGVLSKETAGALSEPEIKRLREEWESRHRGTENAHRISILSGGLKWQEIARSQKDMDFVEQRRFSRDEILALFRVPKTAIGIVEDVNRANAEATEYIFAKRTIDPLMGKIVSTLNEFLVSEFQQEGEVLELWYESPVPEDRFAVITEYTNGHNKWLTTNDIRRQEGLTPSTNGDKFYAPFSLAPIDEVPQEQPVKNAKPVVKTAKKAEGVEGIVDKFISALPKAVEPEIAHVITAEMEAKYIDLWKLSFDVEKGGLPKKLNEYFSKQEAEVQANIARELKGLEAKEYKYKAVEDFLFDEPANLKTGISLLTPYLERYVKQASENSIDLGGVLLDMNSKLVQGFIKERAAFSFGGINDTTKDALLKTLHEGINASEDGEQLSQRVADVYGQARDYRSDRIAITEVSASSNFGAIESFREAGITKFKWVVVNPEDEDCIGNEGEVRDYGESFPSGDTQPPAHPNCQCSAVPVVE